MAADRPDQWIGDLAVARDRRAPPIGQILENGMAVPLADQGAAVLFEMANQIASLHGAGVATCSEMCCPV